MNEALKELLDGLKKLNESMQNTYEIMVDVNSSFDSLKRPTNEENLEQEKAPYEAFDQKVTGVSDDR